ncbi:transposase [Megasphaera massiliensis]|uniref:transposase n=1 Tax=Megasphaera massiliensis TaxID=1232428 RepID=UPI0038B33931
MSLTSLFRRVVQTMFPCVTIMGDRFHIKRLVIWAQERVRKRFRTIFVRSEFRSVLKTFKDWRQAILNGLTQVYSNGFTEGMNNKINVLKRAAFGFQNFERFRIRILWASLKE